MRIHPFSFDSTIKSGLAVIVSGRIYPAEPDIGIFHPQVEIEDILWRKSGKPIPECLWEHAMQYDLGRLEQEALSD